MGTRERKAWTKVLQLMRELTYLYDKQNAFYTNHTKRQEGYNMLLEIYNDIAGDERTMPAFKKKLENMRTTFMKEVKKVNESRLTAASAKDVHKPTLWYYSLMDFLESPKDTSLGHTEMYIFDENDVDECPELLEIEEKAMILAKRPKSEREPSMRPRSSTPKLRMTLRANPAKMQKEEFLVTPQEVTQREEDWELIGRSIGLQMRDMDKHQLAIAQKIIGDAIFYGKIGKLTKHSQITLESDMCS